MDKFQSFECFCSPGYEGKYCNQRKLPGLRFILWQFDDMFNDCCGIWIKLTQWLPCVLASTASNCSVQNGDCDHECNLRSDGLVRTCSCLPGYSIHENSRTCSPISKNIIIFLTITQQQGQTYSLPLYKCVYVSFFIDNHACGRILIHKSSFNTGPIQGLLPWLIGGEVGMKGESPWQVQ